MVNQIEITRHNIPSHNTISPVGAEIMQGQRAHERVFAPPRTTASILTDAAEEIGMSVAHRRGDRTDRGTLDKMAKRRGQLANIEALTRIAEFYDKLPDMPRQENLRQLIGRFQNYQEAMGNQRGGGERPTSAELLQLLSQFDPDITHQYAAFSLIRDFFRQRVRRGSAASAADDDFETLLDETASEFERTDKMRDIQAGFASARIASARAPALGTDAASLRESYRTMLRESRHFGQLFDGLAKYDMQGKFEDIVEMFIKVAAEDLASTAGSSTDPAFLGALLTELGKLKKLKTVHQSMGEVVENASSHLQEQGPSQTDLTSRLFHFSARQATGMNDAKKLVAGLSSSDALAPLLIANGMYDLHCQIPDEVMPTMTARQRQTAALRSLLDFLVAQEEQAYALEMERQAAQEDAAGRDAGQVH